MIHFEPLSFILGAACASGVLFVGLVIRDAWRKRGRDDYIDWGKVPEGWDWVYVGPPEENGKVFMADSPQEIRMGGAYESWMKKDGIGGWDKIPKSAIIGPLPPWRESLRHRPGK